MAHEFEEHWLSAYLDNELSADERALVEQRLQTDPAVRQLFDDLKRVRSLVATLPGWQGSDLQPAIPNMLGAAPSANEPGDGEGAAPGTTSQVQYSTSLAESRLRERENAAAAQTRRSMRWTTLVAVAAGLATVMLGAPYVFRSSGPVTEIAQHVDTPATTQASPDAIAPEPSSAPPSSAPPSNAPAGLAKKASEEMGRVTSGEHRDRDETEFDALRNASLPSLAAPDSTVRDTARFHRPAAEGATSEYFFDANAPKEFSDAELPREMASGGMPGSGTIAEAQSGKALDGALGGYGGGIGGGGMQAGAMPSETAANGAMLGGRSALRDATPPRPAPLAPQKPELDLSLEPAPSVVQDARNYAAPAADGPALPGQPAAPEAKFQSLEALKAQGGPEKSSLGIGLSEEAAVSTQIVTARSDAWTEAQATKAMHQVWYFITPGANTNDSESQPQLSYGLSADQKTPAAGSTNDWVQSSATSADIAVSEGISASAPFSKQRSSGRQTSAGDAASKAPASSAAASRSDRAPATAASTPEMREVPPAIGLARLPADETGTAWLEKLRKQQSLTRLEGLAESEQLARLNEQNAAAVRATDAGRISGKSQAGKAQTVVLFVSAAEAREILQSLESDREKAALFGQTPPQDSKDARGAAGPATRSAGELPPAWWTRPQALFKKNADKDADATAIGDEKVILILSQLPAG